MTEHEIENSKDIELFPSSNVLKQKLYCIVDFKSLTILPPFLAQNDEEAKRNFINVLNYSNSTICRFPEDFKLYCIGDYVVSFTGSFDTAKDEMIKYLFGFTPIVSGDSCIQPDTFKYDDLVKKVETALQQVSNSNQVLVDQIGNVPNLEKSINLITSKQQSFDDKLSHLVDQIGNVPNLEKSINLITSKQQFFEDKVSHLMNEYDNIVISSKKSILDKLFK